LTPDAQLLKRMKFNYAIKLHSESWISARIKAEAHEYAHGCVVVGGVMIKPGTVKTTREYNITYKDPKVTSPASYSLCEVSNPNVMLSALKLSEDKSGIILRLYNTTNLVQETTIVMNIDWKKLELVNMLEEPVSSDGVELKMENHSISLKLTGKKVYTYKFSF